MTSSLLALMVATTLAAPQTPAPAAGSDDPTPKAPSSPSSSSPSLSSPQTAGTPTIDPDALGISLEKIQKAVTRPAAIKLTENRQVFRVEVFGENPTIVDILGPDFLRGPIPNAPMTHQEFLAMVTPKDVQGYAAFSNGQGMVVAATSIALQWALQKALDKYKDARNDRAKAAATKEVQQALDALRRARREAGLPDR
jgi:hypothetical protein